MILKLFHFFPKNYTISCPELFEKNIWFQQNSFARYIPNTNLFILINSSRFNDGLFKVQWLNIYNDDYNNGISIAYQHLRDKTYEHAGSIRIKNFSGNIYISDNLEELTKRYENLTLLG